MAERWKEITVYVHGITPEEYVNPHTELYDKFHELVNKEIDRLRLKKMIDKPLLGEAVKAEWGWGTSQDESTGQTADKYLADAERNVAEKFWRAYKDERELPLLHPWGLLGLSRIALKKIRNTFLYGIADMFYYVSEEGKRTIRKSVFEKIMNRVERILRAEESEARKISMLPENVGISLTLIGHSAGTVILHDLLFALFCHKYDTGLPDSVSMARDVIEMGRNLAKQERLRLRKFYIFGSPITPLTFRSDSLVVKASDAQSAQGFLNLDEIGIKNYPGATNPRWVNFWDPDDAIAYPVSFLYKNSQGIVEDKCVDVSDSAFKAHGAYWRSKKVARHIAETY